MCGICGLVGPPGSFRREWIAGMNQVQIRRGPDGEGEYGDPGTGGVVVALGHRRLAILDLETGSQPMTASETGTTVVFNGEIYNYRELRAELEDVGARFRTRSDTEVLLHGYDHWGPEGLLDRLDGMFALGLWDPRRRRLFLARDRAGQKPLFCMEIRGGGLAFASTLAALRQLPVFAGEPDSGSLLFYFTLRHIPAPRTIFRNVFRLAPGEYALWEEGRLRKAVYWSPPEEGGCFPIADETTALREFRSRLLDSVRECLVADVPVSLLLSSGLDSASVAAALAELPEARDVAACTVSFSDPVLDESEEAARIASRLGLRHEIRPLDDPGCEEEAEAFLKGLDEPFGDPSVVPTLRLCRAVSRFTRVALGGDGGDELFGGYPTFQALPLWRLWRMAPLPVGALCRLLARTAPTGGGPYSLGAKVRRFAGGLDPRPSQAFGRWLCIFSPEEAAALLGLNSTEPFDDLLESLGGDPGGKDGVSFMSRLYFRLFLPGVLEKVDRAAMHCSLEVRAPFLQRRMVEFGLRLPARFRVRRGQTKYLLRRSLAERLPGCAGRPKRGFNAPVSEWMRGRMGSKLEEALRDPGLGQILDVGRAAELLAGHRSGQIEAGERLWLIRVLALHRGVAA